MPSYRCSPSLCQSHQNLHFRRRLRLFNSATFARLITSILGGGILLSISLLRLSLNAPATIQAPKNYRKKSSIKTYEAKHWHVRRRGLPALGMFVSKMEFSVIRPVEGGLLLIASLSGSLSFCFPTFDKQVPTSPYSIISSFLKPLQLNCITPFSLSRMVERIVSESLACVLVPYNNTTRGFLCLRDIW